VIHRGVIFLRKEKNNVQFPKRKSKKKFHGAWGGPPRKKCKELYPLMKKKGKIFSTKKRRKKGHVNRAF